MNAEHFQEAVTGIVAGDIPASSGVLVRLLETASDAYYNTEGDILFPVVDFETGELTQLVAGAVVDALIDDSLYDALERLLKSIDPKNSFFLEVGSDVRGGKVPLPFKMGSLDQVYEGGETLKWVKDHGLEDADFVISDKLDGTSAAVIYNRKGEFNSAFSRGNGTLGADITRHVKKFSNVPAKGAVPDFAARCEVILPVAKWPEVRDATVSRSGRLYKNARNYTAGRMNASDSDDIFLKNIHLVVTSVEVPEVGKMQQLEMARKAGFLTNYYVVVKGRDLTDEFLTQHLNERRAESAYELDGIVIDIDDYQTRMAIPKTSSSLNPQYAKKYKVADAANYAEVKVQAVLWRPSKAGYLKPRIMIEPTDLAGVTITYATGFNAKFIKDNGIGPGAIVKLTRSGDVIPYVTGVIKSVEPQMPTEAEFGSMSYTPGDVDLVMDDLDAHPDVRYYRILDVFKSLDVPHLKQGSVEKLIAAGFDSEVKIIKATLVELQKVLGDSAGKKVCEGLKSKLNPIEEHLLVGSTGLLGRGIGRRKCKRVVDAFGRTDVTLKELLSIEGFEQKTASLYVNNYPKVRQFLADIQGHYAIAQPKAKVTEGDLAGICVVFTGVRDKELEATIEAKAGRIGSSVNKETTHLVCKDPTSGSSKMKKASDLGVKIIDLATAQELFG